MVNIVLQPAKKYNLYFIFLLLFYTIWVYYLCFINLPKGDFYIPNDEFMIPDSGIFAWYGLPSRCLEWPASPMLFFYYLLIGIFTLHSFIYQHFFQDSNISFFEVFDQQVYDYLTHKPDYLVSGRVFQFVMVIILTTLSFQKFKKTNLFKNNETGLILFFALILSCQTLLSTTAMVRPDSIAILLAVYLISICFSNEIFTLKGQILLISIFALLMSFRTIFVFFFPVILYLTFTKRNSNSYSKKFFIVGLFLVFTIILNPFLITDTFLFLKAFLGNIIGKRHSEMNSYYNFDFILQQINENKLIPIYIIFSIIGLAITWQKGLISKVLLGLIIVVNFIYLHSVLTSPTLFTTHIAPLLPVFFLFAALGFSQVTQKKNLYFGIVFCAILLGNFFVNKSATRGGFEMNYFSAANWLKKQSDIKSIAIPEQLDVLFADIRSKKSYQLEYNLLTNNASREAKLSKLYSFSDTTKKAFNNGLMRSFMFDEENIKATAAFISIEQTPENKANSKMIYLFDDHLQATGIAPLHSQPMDNLMPLFSDATIEYFLTKNQWPIPNFEIIKQFDQGSGEPYFVYQQKKPMAVANGK